MNRNSQALTTVLLVLLTFSIGCMKHRVQTIAAPMDLTWASISEQAVIGGASSIEIEAFGNALAERNFDAMRISWPPIRAAYEAGIMQRLAEGEIGNLGAESYREQLANFEEAMGQI